MSTNARSVYLQGIGQDASPVRLIVLLYEQLIADLRRAAAAVEQGDIASRTHQLSHALQVLGELEGSLNLEAGQEVARNLGQFYRLLRNGVFQVQLQPNQRVLEKYISSLLSLREAWIEVERQGAVASAPGQAAQGTYPAGIPPEAPRGHWSG